MYKYEDHKHKILTDEGQRDFLKVRDRVKKLLKDAGAFMMFKALVDISGDTWTMQAHIDRLVELEEIQEISGVSSAGQHRVFVEPLNHINK